MIGFRARADEIGQGTRLKLTWLTQWSIIKNFSPKCPSPFLLTLMRNWMNAVGIDWMNVRHPCWRPTWWNGCVPEQGIILFRQSSVYNDHGPQQLPNHGFASLLENHQSHHPCTATSFIHLPMDNSVTWIQSCTLPWSICGWKLHIGSTMTMTILAENGGSFASLVSIERGCWNLLQKQRASLVHVASGSRLTSELRTKISLISSISVVHDRDAIVCKLLDD